MAKSKITNSPLVLKTKLIGLTIFLMVMTLESCVSVEAYQKVYLNDENMELNARKVAMYETFFQAYREGASGANGGKTGGGCGCN